MSFKNNLVFILIIFGIIFLSIGAVFAGLSDYDYNSLAGKPHLDVGLATSSMRILSGTIVTGEYVDDKTKCTVCVGKKFAGKRVRISVIYSNDGEKLNRGIKVPKKISKSGLITVYSKDAFEVFPDKAKITIYDMHKNKLDTKTVTLVPNSKSQCFNYSGDTVYGSNPFYGNYYYINGGLFRDDNKNLGGAGTYTYISGKNPYDVSSSSYSSSSSIFSSTSSSRSSDDSSSYTTNYDDRPHKYFASKRSDKFHETYCSQGSRIKDSNKIYYNTRRQALDDGKEPCKICEP